MSGAGAGAFRGGFLLVRLKRGDAAGARDAFQRAVNYGVAEVTPAAAFDLGVELARLGDVEGAAAAFNLASETGTPDVVAKSSYNLGLVLRNLGDDGGACASFLVAFHTGDPGIVPLACMQLGIILAEQGDAPAAYAAFQAAADHGPPEAAAEAFRRQAELTGGAADHGTVSAGQASAGYAPGDASAMPELSDRDRVGRGLEILAAGLAPFVHARMSAASPGGTDWVEAVAARDRARFGGDRQCALSDPRFLLRVITEEWAAFRSPSPQTARGYATELRDAGNRWAHGDAFSADDTSRALDTMERLLAAAGAADQAAQVRGIRASMR